MKKNNTGIFQPKKFTKKNLRCLKKILLEGNKTNPVVYFEAFEMGYDIDTLVDYISHIPTELHIIDPNGIYTAYRLNDNHLGEENEFHLEAMTDYVLTSPYFQSMKRENMGYDAEEILLHSNCFILRTYLSLVDLNFCYIVYMPKQMTEIQRPKISEVCSRYCRMDDIKDDDAFESDHTITRAYRRKLYLGGMDNLKKMGTK